MYYDLWRWRAPEIIFDMVIFIYDGVKLGYFYLHMQLATTALRHENYAHLSAFTGARRTQQNGIYSRSRFLDLLPR